MEVLYFLKWRPALSDGHDNPPQFEWVAWAYLGEINEVYRANLLRESERAGLLFKIAGEENGSH
jgi:hypothetical protein